MSYNLKHNFLQLGIALDQLLNVVLSIFTGNKAWADETMSARAWRHKLDGSRSYPAWIVDHIFFWQDNHCKTAYESEMERMHVHPSLRK